MLANMPFSELVWLAVAAVAAGVVTGILAGLFGIGGGIIVVPVLFELFRIFGVPQEVRMQLCVGTSLAIIVPTIRPPIRPGPEAAATPSISANVTSASARARITTLSR